MATSNGQLTIQDFRDIHLNEVLESATEKQCYEYTSSFFSKSTEAEQAGESGKASVYRLLGKITSLYLSAGNHSEPFRAAVIFEDRRSAIVDDFSQQELEVLRELVPEISDSELRARIADVVWLRLRDYKMAEIAVDSYLESAERLEDPQHWSACFERIERAFRLAASLGDETGYLQKVVQRIENMLDNYQGEDPLYLSEKLMSLLCERRIGDATKYGNLAEKAAKKAESEHDWSRSQVYWQRKAGWDEIAKDENARRTSLINAAETYVRLAQGSIGEKNSSYMLASSHLVKAIEAYRRIGGMSDRVNELHKLLLKYEEESLKELGAVKSPAVDLTNAIEGATKAVRGKNFLDAIFTMVLNFRIEGFESLRKGVEAQVKETPLIFFIGASMVNERGKVVGKRKGILTDDKSQYEEALRSHMFQNLQMGYQIDVKALINPMRRQINLEHYVNIDDLAPIIQNNPLIPQHRELLYAKGLLSGLQGDFLSAIHLLVPQFENSVRYLLEQHGVLTSKLDDEGIQEEYDLNRTLYLDQTKKIFEEDITFYLQGLLVEKEGSNIRNRMAHGLMYPGDFYSPECVYLWALILKLVCWPSLAKIHGTQENEAKEK